MKSLIRLEDKSRRPVAIAATGLFLCSMVLYFAPVALAHKITLPVGILALASLWLCPWQMTFALAFSAAGDYFGSAGNFMAQMGSFAVAHIWFIVFFAVLYHRRSKNAVNGKRFAFGATFCSLALLATAFILIVPHAPVGILQIGVSVYACLICAMLLLALLQRDFTFGLGAVLFVISDFILAWELFVSDIPHSGLLIMIPYYSAQWLLYKKSTSFRD